MDLEAKLRKIKPSKESLKRFAWEQLFPIAFGVYDGASNGAYSHNLEELRTGAIWFGAFFPTLYKFTGHHKTWKDAAWHGAKATAAYMVARNLTQLVMYGKI